MYGDENIFYFNEDSGNAAFIFNEVDIPNINPNNINLDDTTYEKDKLAVNLTLSINCNI